MTQVKYLRKMVDGLPVLAAPAEIDLTNVGHLQADLLHLFNLGHHVIVLDMRCTTFCDSAGLQSMLRVHQGIQADGGGLRLVVSQDGEFPRMLASTGISDMIPCFASLPKALGQTADGAEPTS